MGKKRVIKKSADSSVGRKKPSRSSKKLPKLEKGRIYIKSTYNNTIVSISDEKGNLIAFSSAGLLGFRGPKKATPYAATKIVESLGEKIQKMGLKDVVVYVKGIGSGRESAIRSLPTQGLNILSIKDITPIPFNGCRPRKARRV
jgi:small subunit ribosomal protein S11